MKRAHISGVMWLLIIFVNAYLSISDPTKTNDTTSVCDDSLQECLNHRHLDSEFPTIAGFHLARMLVEINSKTLMTTNRKAPCPIRVNRYSDCFPPRVGKKPTKTCHWGVNLSCVSLPPPFPSLFYVSRVTGHRSRTPLLHSFVVSIAVQCSEMASSGLEHRWTKLSVRHPTRPSDQPSTSTNEHQTEQPPISSDGPPTSSNVPPNDQPSTSVNQPQ
ncbi:hypothetical protein V8G54_020166 [Vigna mungo]|uniref:Uncharacterized protein n=1 Tax=Vigna mungo TaxID=3915 RepID=A0AAQ3ND70_VIGMU